MRSAFTEWPASDTHYSRKNGRMAAKNGKIDVAREYIEKYIQLGIKHNRGYSKKYIATVLSEDHPDLFKNIEDARTFVRAATNTKGFRDHSKAGEDLARRMSLIGQPYLELEKQGPFVIPRQYKRPLIIADLHSKFYDRKAVGLAIEYGLKTNCDSVIIDGDFMDFYVESKFDRSALTLKGFEDEQEWGVDMLQLLQDCFGKVFLKKGNHDIRRENLHQQLAVKYPSILEMSDYADYLFFDGSTVDVIEDYQKIIFGKLNIIHGHEFPGGGIHIAYNRLNKAMDNILSAHSHITKHDSRCDINGNMFGSWVLGCMCNLHPRYSPSNGWNQGFARAEIVNDDGEFEVHNRRIVGNVSKPA
mgnify:FL=1